MSTKSTDVDDHRPLGEKCLNISYTFSLVNFTLLQIVYIKPFLSTLRTVYIYTYLFCSTVGSKHSCFSSRIDSSILGGITSKVWVCNPKCSLCFPRIYSSPLFIVGYMVTFEGVFRSWLTKCHWSELTILSLGPSPSLCSVYLLWILA